MEAARNLLSSPPSYPTRTHLKNALSHTPPCSSSVSMLQEQAPPAVTSIPVTSVARLFPTSVLLQEQRDEYRPLLNFFKEEKTSLEMTEKRQTEMGASAPQEKTSGNTDQSGQIFERRLLQWPGLWHLLLHSDAEEGDLSSSPTMQSVVNHAKTPLDVEPCNAVALAKKALSASNEAASLAEEVKQCVPDLDDSLLTGLGSNNSSNLPVDEEEVVTVRSTRRLDRQSKKRRVPKSSVMVQKTYNTRKSDVQRKLNEGFNPNDHLRLFLWGPETKQLLTAKEELKLIAQVQDLMRLHKLKSKLQSQFGCEPTMLEWAEAVGLSCHKLQLELYSGHSSREKLIHANLRMVVHIAKQYQGHGLSLQDLLQEGSMGLMKSIEKFKPQVGCRFATYAYWWIRQTIRKAIFHHSRTIRLPENVYGILSKVTEARKSYIQEGNYCPSREELAQRAGITVEKLEKLLLMTRMPLSMQQPVWAEQDTTFQEVTSDNGIEIPDVSVTKQLMRQHVLNLLNILSPKERRIIKLRYGIEGGKQNSLAEIGKMFGLSKERVRQLESRALYKFKQCLNNQGLAAFADLLV